MKQWIVGIDIGGTKCAVNIGSLDRKGNLEIRLIDKLHTPTPDTPSQTITWLIDSIKILKNKHDINRLSSIGISCGGPLDSTKGIILSPPNLPGWEHIDIIKPFLDEFKIPVGLQNDANACALAEWKWGAGRGCQHMIFLTFGTGMGAGLIINNSLYSGANDMAGEIGHIRIADKGPIGYGKEGSFEGFCSGGGIAQLAASIARHSIKERNVFPLYCTCLEDIDTITTMQVAEAANKGDAAALEVFEISGTILGKGLALLVDVLNPQRIIIGSIYTRQQSLLQGYAMKELHREALHRSRKVCSIVPSELGEQVGDYAGLSVAQDLLKSTKYTAKQIRLE